MPEEKIKALLWKYDQELGIAYFCPSCKTFICSHGLCRKCGQEINWDETIEYKGKVNWD